MRIPKELYDQMLVHAQADAPNECCGMVATRSGEGGAEAGEAVRVYRAQNTAASPLKFVIDPQELFRTYSAIEDEGLDFGAIYHSHTRTEPYPSQTDINFASGWPGVQWLIFGLAESEPTARIYEIRDGRVVESELKVE